MSYSILSVYLLLSASVRHAPFRYRSNPTFRSPASLALSLFPAFFLFLRFFLHLLLSLSFVPILSPLFSLFLTLLARSSRLSSFLSLLSPSPSLSHISHLTSPPPHFLTPPPAFGGPPPESGRSPGESYDSRTDRRTCGVLFRCRFFRRGFFYRCFFCGLRFGFFGYSLSGSFGR